MVRAELHRLARWEERHERLLGRLAVAGLATLVVDGVGTALTWLFEHGADKGDIHGIGDALFFTTVQILTISSSMANPLTTGGRIVDVGLELWGVFVITAVGGSFAAFFRAADD